MSLPQTDDPSTEAPVDGLAVFNPSPDPESPEADAPEPETSEPDVHGPDAPESGHLAKIIELNREMSSRRTEYLLTAESAKDAKKALEAAQDRLNALIRSLDESYPLFDSAAPSSPAPEADAGPAEPSAPEPDPPLWRSISVYALETHGLATKVCSKLDAAGIETIGDLADWSAVKGRTLTDVPGVGHATVDKIDTALLGFWATQPAAAVTSPIPAPGGEEEAT